MSGEQPRVIGSFQYRWDPGRNPEFPYVGPDGMRYRIHKNGGGLVAQTAVVADTVHVGFGCRVFGKAYLAEKVRLTGMAQVGGAVVARAGVTFCGCTYLTEGEFKGWNTIIHNRVA